MATIPTVPTFADNDSDLTPLQELSDCVSFLVDCDVNPTWHSYKTATQSLSSGTTYQSVDFGSSAFDSDGVFNEPGATIVTPGYYKTEACVQVEGNGTGFRLNVHFLVTFGDNNVNFSSGATKVYGSRGTSASSETGVDSARVISAICPYALYPGDVITVNISVGNTSTLDNNSNTSYIQGRFVCNFTGKWIGVPSGYTPPAVQDHINGFTLHEASGDFTAQAGKFYIVDCKSSDITIQLPSAADASDEAVMIFKYNSGPHKFTLVPVAGEHINRLPNSFAGFTVGFPTQQAGQGFWVYRGDGGWWCN